MKANNGDISDGTQFELPAAVLKGAAHSELAAGVLKQAAQDLRRFHGASSRVERELYLDASNWVMSDDYSWPFSFLNVCRVLDCAPEQLRQELIGDLSFGPFRQWTRRCGRTAGRLQTSFHQLFLNGRNATARYA